MLGTRKVGKSSVVKCFLGYVFDDHNNPNLTCEDFDAGIFLEVDNKLKQFDLVFQDFHGSFRYDNPLQYRQHIEKCHGFVLVHTKNEIESFPQVLEMLADIRKVKGEKFTSILIMENKCDDLCYYGDKRTGRRSFDLGGCLNAAVSSKQNVNVTESIGNLVRDIEVRDIKTS